MSTVTADSGIPTIVDRSQLFQHIPGLKANTLAYLLRNRADNGLSSSGAVIKPGKEFLFDLNAFTAYLLSRKG